MQKLNNIKILLLLLFSQLIVSVNAQKTSDTYPTLGEVCNPDDINHWSENVDKVYQMFGDFGYQAEDCQKSEQVRNSLNQMLDFAVLLTDGDTTASNSLMRMIRTELSDKLNDFSGTENINRYKQGRFIGQIAAQILIAAATEGGGNIEEGFASIALKLKSVPSKIGNFVKFLGKSVRDLPDLIFKGNTLKSGETVLLKLSEADEFIILKKLPDNATGYTPIENARFKNVDYSITENDIVTKGKADLEIVEYNKKKYVLVTEGAGKSELLTKLTSYPNITKVVNRLDEVTDANLLSKIDDLATNNPSKLTQLEDLYSPSKFKLPSDRPIVNGVKKNGDFTIQRTINGENVSVYYNKAGFPDFNPFSPGEDYKFISPPFKSTRRTFLPNITVVEANDSEEKFLSGGLPIIGKNHALLILNSFPILISQAEIGNSINSDIHVATFGISVESKVGIVAASAGAVGGIYIAADNHSNCAFVLSISGHASVSEAGWSFADENAGVAYGGSWYMGATAGITVENALRWDIYQEVKDLKGFERSFDFDLGGIVDVSLMFNKGFRLGGVELSVGYGIGGGLGFMNSTSTVFQLSLDQIETIKLKLSEGNIELENRKQSCPANNYYGYLAIKPVINGAKLVYNILEINNTFFSELSPNPYPKVIYSIDIIEFMKKEENYYEAN